MGYGIWLLLGKWEAKMWARDAELLGKIVAACTTGALWAKRRVKRVGSSGSRMLVKKGAEGKCGNAGMRDQDLPFQTLFETSPSYLRRHQPKPWEERTASKRGQTTQVRPKRYTWSTVCIPEVCDRICQKGILQEERQSKTPGTKQIGWDLIELIRRKLSPTNEKGKRKIWT